ncbi:hypothetical protein JXO52_14310 [bacterium]|nr:hypothetical protein [bacterium]
MKKINLRTMSILVTGIALAAALSGCGPKNGIVGDPVKGMALAYSLGEGQSLTYSSSITTTMNTEQMGQAFTIDQGQDIEFTITGQGKDSEGNYISALKFDAYTQTMEGVPGMQSPDVSDVPGHVMEYIFSPQGKRIALNDPDTVMIDLGQMNGGPQPLTAMIQVLLASLPKDVKKIGDTWTDTRQDTTQRMGMDVINSSETTYTIETEETVNGYKCLKILAETTGTIDGSGETQGMQLTIEGDVETTTTVYFAYMEQKMVKQVSESFSESTVVVSGPVNMTQPVVTESKITVELVK